MEKSEEKLNDQRSCIDRFLADNQELEELSAKLSEFNVFRALKIEQVEIRHSNVLAWLLDPDGSHGLSDNVLRRMLSNVLLLSETSISGISAAEVELMDFSDIEVLREWKNIDILLIDRGHRIVLFFENKINSGESKGQLVKYKRIIDEEFPDYTLVPVFLTLTGQQSIDQEATGYITYSHEQLLSLLTKLFEQRKSQLAEAVQVFLQQYLDTLRRLTMQDKELIELCKRIYRKHQTAIDMIIEYGKASVFQQAVEDLLEKEGDFEVHYSSYAYVWFIPNSWIKLIPENGIAWTNMKRPISVCCWIEDWKDSFSIHFEVSKMSDPDLRLRLVNELKDAGFKLSSKAFDREATFSRFYASKARVKDKSDYEEVYEALEKLLKKAKKEFPKAEKVFHEVFGQPS